MERRAKIALQRAVAVNVGNRCKFSNKVEVCLTYFVSEIKEEVRIKWYNDCMSPMIFNFQYPIVYLFAWLPIVEPGSMGRSF